MGLMLIDKLREVKLEVDSLWGEFRRQNDLNRTQFSKHESRMDDFDATLKEMLASQREIAASYAQLVQQVAAGGPGALASAAGGASTSSSSIPYAPGPAGPGGSAADGLSLKSPVMPISPKRVTGIKSAAHKLTLLNRFMQPTRPAGAAGQADGGGASAGGIAAWDAGKGGGPELGDVDNVAVREAAAPDARLGVRRSPTLARRELEAKLAALALQEQKQAGGNPNSLFFSGGSSEAEPNFNFTF